jgi:sugar/nucleoside kinase (ribokinase family)
MNHYSDKTYLLVGHVTKDLLPEDKFTTGGTVTYAGVIVRNLGWRPIIVTVAAPDFVPPSYLAESDWRLLPSPATTTFRNVYDAQGNRQQTIGPVARPITPADIPADCRNVAVIHFCPLAQELSPATVKAFVGGKAMLTATPQGWMRYWDTSWIVSTGQWQGAEEILPSLQAAVLSIEDVRGDWTIPEYWARQIPTLVVTQGDQGCTVFHHGRAFSVPPRPAQPVDPTGAGDVFAAAFFVRLCENDDLWQAAYFANVTASMAIERFGPEGAPTRTEVEAYIAQHPVQSQP